MRCLVVSTIVLALLAPPVLCAAELWFDNNAKSHKRGVRVWRDINGKEVIEGRFEDIVHDTVHLVHEDGLRRTIKFEELCLADQELIDRIVDFRTQFFFWSLGAVPVRVGTVEVFDAVAISDPVTGATRIAGILKSHPLDAAVPIANTLEKLQAQFAEHLAGKTVRLSGKVANSERPRNSTRLKIDFVIHKPAITIEWWQPTFRNCVYVPARLLEGTTIQAGDVIHFEGRFATSIEPCPKCKATGLVRVNCSYCSGGVTRRTVQKTFQTPDGARGVLPVGERIRCPHCNGITHLPCDHIVRPQEWNPFDLKDEACWVIGQLRFEKNLSHALCFRLEEMSVSFVSNLTGNTLRLSRPSADSAIEVKVRKN